MDQRWEYHLDLMRLLGTVEVPGYTLVGADNLKVGLDGGTKLGSSNGSLDCSNYVIT